MMNDVQLAALVEAQQQVIKGIALGTELAQSLQIICEQIESLLQDPHAYSSILLLEGQSLRHGAAPRLPKAYCDTIDGVQIGPKVGSCGTAAFRKQQVIVTEIDTDPLWADFKHIALQYNLHACWSQPILSSSNEVLGSFAIYYDRPKAPSEFQLDLINRFTDLSSLAIEKDRLSSREKRLHEQLLHSKEKFEAFTSVIPDLGLVLDENGTYVDIYGAVSSLLYKQSSELLGRKVCDVIPPELASEVMSVIATTLETNEVQVFEYALDVQKGEIVFEGRTAVVNHYDPEHPDKRHILWMARDITARKVAERRIEELAFYDSLTGLPNRRLLLDRLDYQIDHIARTQEVGGVLFLDLDDFKRINDSLGHSVGDVLLAQVAQRLQGCLREADTLARIGGDEFVVVLDTLAPSENEIGDHITTVSQRILHAMTEPFTLGKDTYRIGTSIGICILDADITPDEVLKRADAAMYRAKNMGRGGFSFYEPALQSDIDKRLEIEREIMQAVEHRQFSAFFQPQLSIHGELLGVEALVRWHHPEKGLISPFYFIPVAEKSGVIYKLQNIVMEDACELLVALKKENIVSEDFLVSINISACQFRTEQLDRKLLEIIGRYRLSPRQFMLEITESILMNNVNDTISQMGHMKKQGFRFSVDDFGTGYSSLAYLHAFPIDELKIDKSFIKQMDQNPRGEAIVDSIVALSNHLEFNVIAEGIETKSQLELLSQRPIKGMQGYFFAEPMPRQVLIEWIKSLDRSGSFAVV